MGDASASLLFGIMGNQACCVSPTPPLKQQLGRPSADIAPGVLDARIDSWMFNPYDLTEEELISVPAGILYAKFQQCCGSRRDVLRNFVTRTRQGYMNNAYHNYYHAVD